MEDKQKKTEMISTMLHNSLKNPMVKTVSSLRREGEGWQKRELETKKEEEVKNYTPQTDIQIYQIQQLLNEFSMFKNYFNDVLFVSILKRKLPKVHNTRHQVLWNLENPHHNVKNFIVQCALTIKGINNDTSTSYFLRPLTRMWWGYTVIWTHERSWIGVIFVGSSYIRIDVMLTSQSHSLTCSWSNMKKRNGFLITLLDEW